MVDRVDGSMDVDHRPHGGRHHFSHSWGRSWGSTHLKTVHRFTALSSGSLPKNPFKGAHLQALIWCIQRGKREEEAVKSRISEIHSYYLFI